MAMAMAMAAVASAMGSMVTLEGAMTGLSLSSSSSTTFFNGGGNSVLSRSPSSSPAVDFSTVRAPITIEAAHKKGAGSTKNGRDSNPKMLGVKIYGNQPAQPGAIIIRQRGTKFHPGKNVGLGRDYTIYSLIDGLVKFEKYGPDRKKVSVYPNLIEKVENPNSRRVKRREEFRAKREKRKAFQLSRLFSTQGVSIQFEGEGPQFSDGTLQLASVPEGDEESEETALC